MVAETSRPVADVARGLAMSETSLGIWVPFHQFNCPEDAGQPTVPSDVQTAQVGHPGRARL
jgi:hypothetical protein